MREGFVYLDEAVPGIRWDAKYAGADNFTGQPVDGYLANRAVGTRELALKLNLAARAARARGLGLFLWDAYRPCRAVACFMRWAARTEDYTTKARHYPNIERERMVEEGYIAARSAHSRGSAVDLTLYRLEDGALLPMGGIFDLMDARSRHGAPGLSEMETASRALLKQLMEDSGFTAYENEWWHYRLTKEPYPNAYFDFPIE